jgi:hypothetical protein
MRKFSEGEILIDFGSLNVYLKCIHFSTNNNLNIQQFGEFSLIQNKSQSNNSLVLTSFYVFFNFSY